MVDSSEKNYSYGLFIGAGTGSQKQSLWPSLSHNETRLASHEFCGQNSPANCADPKYTHGHYGSDASTTWKEIPQYTSLDLDVLAEKANLTFGTDNLNVFTHYFDPSPPTKYVVEQHPITIMSDYSTTNDVFFNSGSLGLGRSSTMLTQLLAAGRITRNVFGMYLGTIYPRAGGLYNGSIVFGGYDAGRLQGEIHKYAQAPIPASGMSSLRVHVKQMSLVTADGSSVGLVTDGNEFDAYISTDQYALEFPASITQQLATALQARPSDDSDSVLQLSQHFDGNLTIILDDGYEITYPSEWIANASNLSPISATSLVSNATAETRPLVFGAAFLHHLYMTVDYDDSSFFLADAKVANDYVQPQALCANTSPIPAGAAKVAKFVQGGLVGAIIGGVVGGLGIIWLLIFFWRKRMQHRISKSKIGRMERGGTAPWPKKSSLRQKTKEVFGRSNHKQRDSKVVMFNDVKRISWSDSDASSIKGVTIIVESKEQMSSTAGIELGSLERTNSEILGQHNRTTADVTASNSLPHPSHFNNPYANPESPAKTPGTAGTSTPRTGNPLLSDFRQHFSEYDDDDDTDLYAAGQSRSDSKSSNRHRSQQRKAHHRTNSDHLREKLGLKVDTGTAPKKKPARLPLRIEASKVTQTPGTPISVRTKRHSLLRRVFPA